LVVLAHRQRLCIRQRHLKLARQFVQTHVSPLKSGLVKSAAEIETGPTNSTPAGDKMRSRFDNRAYRGCVNKRRCGPGPANRRDSKDALMGGG
jgi:hypothetical protein